MLQTTQTNKTARPPVPRAGLLRQIVEMLVCLAIAVILFRTFQMEGYMISTGSMAPTLLGYHQRVVCPSCRKEFAYGVAYDDDYSSGQVSATARRPGDPEPDILGDAATPEPPPTVTCPNCGQPHIDVSQVPHNHGDQLLVHKVAYETHEPRRWEVIVFRNPEVPTVAYVKRLLGLPGESIQICHGDVYIDGKIARKGLVSQQAMRILVFDQDYQPEHDSRWQSRWTADDSADPQTPRWTAAGTGFQVQPPQEVESLPELPVSWLRYQHWIRQGGTHISALPLQTIPNLLILDHTRQRDARAALTESDFSSPVQYDSLGRELICTGVLSNAWLKRLLAQNADSEVQEALVRLQKLSHFAPVTDFYGYNRWQGNDGPQVVPDLMLSARFRIAGGHGQLVIRMTHRHQEYDCVLDVGRQLARLHRRGQTLPLRQVPLPRQISDGQSFLLEMSVFDEQALVAVDSELLFEPWENDQPTGTFAVTTSPVRIGSRGLDATVDSLKLYRDVHYTRGRAVNAISEPYQLGPDEFFVLGDNSPVSSDSRCWEQPTVPRELLLGKPFLVHLPSQPGRLKLGHWTTSVRIPDFSKVRSIR